MCLYEEQTFALIKCYSIKADSASVSYPIEDDDESDDGDSDDISYELAKYTRPL